MIGESAHMPPRRMHWALRFLLWVLVALGIVVTGYLLTAWRISMLRPNIAVDSLAAYRALLPDRGDGEIAWPRYVEAVSVPFDDPLLPAEPRERATVFDRVLTPPESLHEDLQAVSMRVPAGSASLLGELIRNHETNEENALLLKPESLRALGAWWVGEHEEALAKLRAAARIRTLGFVPAATYDDDTQRRFGVQPSLQIAPWADAPMLSDLSEFHIWLLRSWSSALCIDASVAADRGDGRRAVDAMLAVRQMSDHAAESKSLFAQIVRSGLRYKLYALVFRLVARHPASFDDRQLGELLAALESDASAPRKLEVEGIRLLFRDMVQHLYSDDGAGDGRFLPAGVALLAAFEPGAWSGTSFEPGTVENFLAGPVTAFSFATRAEVMAAEARVFELLEEQQSKPVWMRNGEPDRFVESLDDKGLMPRHQVTSALLPTLGNFAARIERSSLYRDQARLAVACELFRRAHGREPKSVAELVPGLLARMPIDPSCGLPYREAVDGRGMLRVWAIGPDAVDDGGNLDSPGSVGSSTDPHEVWRAIHGFHAREGRFPDAAELDRACQAEGVAMPGGASYALVDGTPTFRWLPQARPGRDGFVYGPPEFAFVSK